MPDLRTITPSARTLWWYLQATGPEQPVPEIADRSGIPKSSIYEAANRYPDLFQLTGSLLRSTAPTSPTTDYPDSALFPAEE